MASDGGGDDLTPSLPNPPSEYPKEQKASIGGENPPTTLDLLSLLNQQSHNQNPNPPSEYPKQQKASKTTPKSLNNLTPEEKIAMRQKAKSFKWNSWSPKITPSVATIPCLPHVLCAMHEELLKSRVYPQDDIYSQLPTKITAKKRFNVKGEAAYLLFGKRYPGSSVGKMNRQFVVDEIRGRWRNKGSMDIVAGPNGKIIGMHFYLELEFFGPNGWTACSWSADEYISVTSEAGDSSIVILKCKDKDWKAVEDALQKAENQLLTCYQHLLTAEYEVMGAATRQYKALVIDYEIELGCALTNFENRRNASKLAQELSFGVQGQGGDDGIGVDDGIENTSVNLDLSLGGCSGQVVSLGAYYMSLKKKKMEDNSRKLKINTPAAAAIDQNILDTHVVRDPSVSTATVSSTLLDSLLDT